MLARDLYFNVTEHPIAAWTAQQIVDSEGGYGDLTCLAFARMLEREYQKFVPPPAFP